MLAVPIQIRNVDGVHDKFFQSTRFSLDAI
jgi:hypothetical protein